MMILIAHILYLNNIVYLIETYYNVSIDISDVHTTCLVIEY